MNYVLGFIYFISAVISFGYLFLTYEVCYFGWNKALIIWIISTLSVALYFAITGIIFLIITLSHKNSYYTNIWNGLSPSAQSFFSNKESDMEKEHKTNSIMTSVFCIVLGILYFILFIAIIIHKGYASPIFPVKGRMPPFIFHGVDEYEDQPFISTIDKKVAKKKKKSKAKKKEEEKMGPRDLVPFGVQDPQIAQLGGVDQLGRPIQQDGGRDPNDINPLEGEIPGQRIGNSLNPRGRPLTGEPGRGDPFIRSQGAGFGQIPDSERYGNRTEFSRDTRFPPGGNNALRSQGRNEFDRDGFIGEERDEYRRDDRSGYGREGRSSYGREERSPYDREDRERYDRGERSPYDRNEREDRSRYSRDDRSGFNQEERSPYNRERGYDREDRNGYGRDERSPNERDERSPYGRDERSPYGRDERSPYGRDDRNGYDRDNRSGYDRDERSPYSRDNRSGYDRNDRSPYSRDGGNLFRGDDRNYFQRSPEDRGYSASPDGRRNDREGFGREDDRYSYPRDDRSPVSRNREGFEDAKRRGNFRQDDRNSYGNRQNRGYN